MEAEVAPMAQPQILQGSWTQLSKRAEELQKYPNLYLIIPAQETASSDGASREENEAKEAARIAAIYAGMGKFSYKGLASEELRRERNTDKEKEERQIASPDS
jgi:hypothetical protein